jgi:hypothetical protein
MSPEPTSSRKKFKSWFLTSKYAFKFFIPCGCHETIRAYL